MPGLRRGAGPQGLLGALDPLQGVRLGEKGPFVLELVGQEGGDIGRRADEGVVGLDPGLAALDGRLQQGRFKGVVVVGVELGLVVRQLVVGVVVGVVVVGVVVRGNVGGRLDLLRLGRRLTCRPPRPTGSA